METVILKHPGEFAVIETDAPDAPPPGHALVRVRRVGICGTDWHAFRGRQPFFSYPRILGHELGVEVEQVNDSSSPLKPGDRCAVEPYLNCGACIACRRGRTNCCANLKVLGVHIDGGMRSRIVVPTNKLHRSEKLSLDQLALVETLGIGCHAVNRADPARGEHVLILGAGPIGLSVIPFVQATGADVIVADISPGRLAFCKSHMNVAHTLAADETLIDQLKATAGGELPTIVIDATGNPDSMARCFELVSPAGQDRVCRSVSGRRDVQRSQLSSPRNDAPGNAQRGRRRFSPDHPDDRERRRRYDAVDYASLSGAGDC